MMVKAPSKVNLYLRVAGALPGGYHAIETLFLPLADPCDELEFAFRADGKREITVACSHPDVPCNEKNLCWKAAKLVLDALNVTDSVEIRIRKRIPVAGGMAGGSSDAAAVIRTLQEQYGNLPDRGASAALECGSDVPFFLNPVPSVGRGRGEILTPLEGLKIPEIRIYPMNFPISAAWAYSHIPPETEKDSRSLDDLVSALRSGDFRAVCGLLRNDLAPGAFRKFPLLEQTRREIEAENPRTTVQLSGSGPTLFSVSWQSK